MFNKLISFTSHFIYIYDTSNGNGSFVNQSFHSIFSSSRFLVCNKKELMSFIEMNRSENMIDILELFLLLFPKAVCAPNIFSVYAFLTDNIVEKEISVKDRLKQEVILLNEILHCCANRIKNSTEVEKKELFSLGVFLRETNWVFAEFVLFNLDYKSEKINKKYLNVWEEIAEFKKKNNNSQNNINTSTDIVDITDNTILTKLNELTKIFRNTRKEQESYATSVANMFKNTVDKNFIFAEAGTGTGKTLGYIATILSFIDKNPLQQVLISTYSKALQKQVARELRSAFKSEEEYNNKVASIKGSNNYICLLHYQNLLSNIDLFPEANILVAILSRWLRSTEDGDMVGGDISPLVFEVFSPRLISVLSNTREECIYNRCKHFKNCFIMAAKHKVKDVNIIISNHTYSLLNSGLGARYIVFDEAHHLFSVADEIFSVNLSIKTGIILKNWINGSSQDGIIFKKEINGLKVRLNNILAENRNFSEDEQALNLSIQGTLEAFILAAKILPATGAIDRIKANNPSGAFERFLYQVYIYILESNNDFNHYYSLEAEVDYVFFHDNLEQSAHDLIFALQTVSDVGEKLTKLLQDKLYFVATEYKFALEEFINVFWRRCLEHISAYTEMLTEIKNKKSDFVYRFIIEREEGNVVNIGYMKNYLDPSKPLAENILSGQKGVTFTSATLTDFYDNQAPQDIKKYLLTKFGLSYLDEYNFVHIKLESPFNYKDNSKILIVNSKVDTTALLSNGIFEVFKASNGGGLAIFTSIKRLKDVHINIYHKMSEQNIKLMAQHINNQKLSTLIDIFRDDVNSCLLGTDSARDGIDVPGESLRLVVFEKIPWPKPDILNNSRVAFFGKEYRDQNIRLKLRQAFGRIIRNETDKGVFILLGSAPSEFLKAFPQEVHIHNKISLEKSVEIIRDFLNNPNVLE